MKVTLHTQGWVGSGGTEKGERPEVSIHVIMEVDGRVIPNVSRVAVVASGEDFTKVVATMHPGELETVVHDQESWKEMVRDHDDPEGAPRRRLYRGSLRFLRSSRSSP